VVARLECALQPDAGETTSTGMRQEVDIRYVVTSLKGTAQHLYEDVYCQRGQMENLIKLHKAQLASDRMSCHSATANQVRLALHTAAFWLMHGVRVRDDPRAPDQNRRASDHPAADELPRGSVVPGRRARPHAVWSLSRVPRRAADQGKSIPNALQSELPRTDPAGRIAGAHPLTRCAKTRHVMHD
jgi:Transposase DDE domain group 1